MSHPAPSTFYRVAGIAGGDGAVILLVNAAKRAGVVPTSALTQLVAPLAEVLALALVAGLYLASGRRSGTFGLVAYLLNSAALAGLVGVEIVINLVFSELPRGTVGSLRAGPLGLALAVVSVAFLLGTLAFVASLLLSREVPVVPLVLYAVGAVPVALRASVPEIALDLGLVTMAVGIAALSAWMYSRSAVLRTWDAPPARIVPARATA